MSGDRFIFIWYRLSVLGHVRHLFDTNGYTDAFQKLLARETIRKQERNVVLAHQFFVWNGQNPETCDSETAVLTSGGLDAIDASVLEPFEYAALGHIHGAQKVGQERFCYCGTPYKYSISEEHHQKGITVVELGEKESEPQIRRLPILCHPDVKRVRGHWKNSSCFQIRWKRCRMEADARTRM